MDAVVTALQTGLTPTAIMAPIADLAPLLVVLIPVAFGIYELRKVGKGAAKGKVRF